MSLKKITFQKARKEDRKQILSWLHQSHIQEYWNKDVEKDFELSIQKKEALFDYWICFYEKKPFGLILTAHVSENSPFAYLKPWIESEGETLLVDFAICEESFLGEGLSVETLKKFASIQEDSVSAFVADPEVKNEKGSHVFEKAGFTRVSTHIKGQGFFKGKPHYIFKMKLHSEN